MIVDLNFNKEFAKVREGSVKLDNGNHKLYKCPAGKWTIGYGWNLEDRGLPESVANQLLNLALSEAQEEVAKNVKGWDNCNFARKFVLIDMCFNCGWTTLSKFKKMLKAIENSDWEKASAEMRNSSWYEQVGLRAKVLEKTMLTGEMQE